MKLFQVLKKIIKDEDKPIDKTSIEKQTIELKKLKADYQIAKNQLKYFHRNQKLEIIKAVLPFLTVLATIIGFYLTFQTQQKQLNVLQSQHTDDAFANDIQQLASSTNQTSKIVALTKLSTYFEQGDSDIHRQLINLFLGYAETDSIESVKMFIQKELCNRVPNEILPRLIEKNKFLATSFPHQNKLFNEKYDTVRFDKIAEAMNWNINSIIECIQQMKEVKNVDFSNTVLNRAELRNYKNKAEAYHKVLTRNNISNLKFINVSFDDAFLNYINFTNDTFVNVSFDRSSLMQAEFHGSIFEGSSFNNFYWKPWNNNNRDDLTIESYLSYEEEYNSWYPSWYGCNIKLKNFSPLCIPGIGSRFFVNSKWNFDSINQKSRTCYDLREYD